MKPDEIAFARALLAAHGGPHSSRDAPFADEIAPEMHPKRLAYILEKWAARDWWDYGVSARSGWFTPAGWAALNERVTTGAPDAIPAR